MVFIEAKIKKRDFIRASLNVFVNDNLTRIQRIQGYQAAACTALGNLAVSISLKDIGIIKLTTKDENFVILKFFQ